MVRRFPIGLAAAIACLTAAPVAAQTADAAQRQALAVRIDRLEAIKAIERLQYAYGYYQDRFFFAEVASLFAQDAPSVQWGDRVWTGGAGVRRFWTGYFRKVLAQGRDGPVSGRLFDLPQWQGVITLADDGRTAQARYRTIGRLAVYRQREFWISGYYENSYVREGGVWKIKALKFCPTWSARYTDGWQDVTQSDALAWLPATPQGAGPTRPAEGAEACARPYPAGLPRDFHFSATRSVP